MILVPDQCTNRDGEGELEGKPELPANLAAPSPSNRFQIDARVHPNDALRRDAVRHEDASYRVTDGDDAPGTAPERRAAEVKVHPSSGEIGSPSGESCECRNRERMRVV